MAADPAAPSQKAIRYAPVCPDCRGQWLQLNGRCPECGGCVLQPVPLAHHIPCAGVFEAPEGLAAIKRCPKCRRHDVAESDHLEAVGEVYHCLDCSAHFPEPVMRLYCHDCDFNHRFADVGFEVIRASNQAKGPVDA